MNQEEEIVVKIEDEMGVFVKEEESIIALASNSAYDENVSINLEDLLLEPRPRFPGIEEIKRELLVYTTKLDDMRVWKRLRSKFGAGDANPKDILNMIITESKPTFSGIHLKKKKRKSRIKFNKMVSKLHIYKEIVAVADKVRFYHDQQQINAPSTAHGHYTAVNKKQKRVIQTINVDDESGGDNSIFNAEHLTDPFVIIQMRSFSDIYFVNNLGIPTGFVSTYSFNLSRMGFVNILNNHLITMLHNCCWFKRHNFLKNTNIEKYGSILHTFMRSPHGCDVTKCACCCRRKYKYVWQTASPKPVQRTVKSHIENRWQQHLISRGAQRIQNSLINVALVHKRKMKPIKEIERKRQFCNHSCLKLQYSNKLTHVYYFGNNGIINTYIKTNIYTLQSFKDMIDPSYLYSNVNICCLTAYKKYCLKLIKLAHPSVVKYLINNIIYKPNKCVNCENLNNDAKGVVVPLYLPKYPRHTKPNSKVTIRGFNILEKINNVQLCTALNTLKENTVDESVNLLKTDMSQNLSERNKSNNDISPNLIEISGLKLAIFPGGKVKMMCKTFPDDISTANLKILKEIILHAQKIVTARDFNPNQPINVRNLFTKKPNTQNNQNNQLETKNDSTNILSIGINPADKRINNNSQSVNKIEVLANITETKIIKRNNNVYEVLTNINAKKRNQYIISHEFLGDTNTNLWENVNVLGNEIFGKDDIYHHSKENAKRKTSEKGTSPPPKLLRKGNLENTINVANIGTTTTIHNTTVSVSEKIQQPRTTVVLPNLTNAPVQKIVPTESFQQLKVPNPSFSLSENVTLIPIGQLPQELVTSLYKQYAFLPDNNQSLNVQAQSLNPITVTEQLFPTTSSLDYSNTLQLSLPNSAQMSADILRVPADQSTQATRIENDDTDPKDDDCILGI